MDRIKGRSVVRTNWGLLSSISFLGTKHGQDQGTQCGKDKLGVAFINLVPGDKTWTGSRDAVW